MKEIDEIYARCEQTTHGIDGALLGTEWVGKELTGEEQCPYILPGSSSYLCCALRSGHQHGHRDCYVGAQSAQDKWVHRESLKR